MKPDPIELELMRSLLEAAAEQMGIVLQRVSFSANIKERRDFSCALFDHRGNLLAQAAHIPVHLGSMPASVEAVLQRLGRLEAGDVAIVNDPFAGGTHLPDITIVAPIFYDSLLIGYSANRAHHADVGGATPGSMTLSRHIDEEGIRIEPGLLCRRGVRDEQLLARFLAAVRTPDERIGDLNAQLAANHVGARALCEIVQRYGFDHFELYGRLLLEYGQRFMASAIREIPEGIYEFEDVMDDDGAGTHDVRLHVRVSIIGDRAEVDFSNTADQVPGCINCPEAVTQSAVYYCFCCLLDELVPLNGGCFGNIDVITRPGSLLHALYPSAVVAGNTETSQRVVDVVFGALAQALPERIPAASAGTMNNVALGSSNWTYYETVGGGSGAGPQWNGESAVHCHMTNTLNTPAEAIELQYPLRIRRFERVPSTGGAGANQGGDGIVRAIEALASCEGSILSERRAGKPYGLSRGQSARQGRNFIRRRDGSVIELPGKCRFKLEPADILHIITPGGGGFGAG